MNKRIVLIGYSGHSYGCVEVVIKQGYSISRINRYVGCFFSTGTHSDA